MGACVSDEVVLMSTIGRVVIITINRPERANAIDPATAARLADCVRRVEADDHVRAAVLTGTGDTVFCAGSDLKAKADGAGAAVTADWGFAGFVRAPRTKPFVAAVNGTAAGGGFELALACDLAVASPNAEFFLPEVARGLTAGGGGLIRLPRRIPYAIACEVVLAGRRLGSAEALALGLVNRVVEPADLRTTAVELATRCADGAPLAVRESLAVLRLAEGAEDTEAWARSEQASERAGSSADGREGPRAFAEKREPRWQGW
jgi:enoyl-CoA hydratase/carnithine racemase